MRRIGGLLLLVLLAWHGSLAGIVLAQEKVAVEQVDAAIKTAMERQRIPGLSLAVVKDGKMVLAKGYGLANVELNVPTTPETVYEIGSVTKQFTATAVMMLAEEGKVGLDDKITKYLSGLPEVWKQITVRNLLTHTSGLRNVQFVPDFARLRRTPGSQEKLVGLLAPLPLQFDPGSKWQYSNTGYQLLGWIIEKTSGMSYDKFLQERIFTPLDMRATQVNDLGKIIKNRAAGYTLRAGTLQNGGYVDMSWPFSAGAIVSTVVDLAKWNLALDERKLLKAPSYQEMWTPVTLKDGQTHGYGFGWSLEKTNGRPTVGHGGSIDGFRSFVVRYPEERLGIIVLANTDSCMPAIIAQRVASLYEPSLSSPK
jgi:D-alanyl-D-alanine carboxypeptidase